MFSPAIAALALLHFQGIPTPKVDHHMHIWSLTASELVTAKTPPVIKVPDDLQKLLTLKEDWDNDKDPAKLTDIYTEDASVIDAGASVWKQGKAALDYVQRSITINRLYPTAYHVDGNMGYITGMEGIPKGDSVDYVSSWQYSLVKGADGRWRIAAESFTMDGPPTPKSATPEELIADLDNAGMEKGVVLSTAYWFASPLRNPPVQNIDEKVRAENDWVAQQVSKFPNRLIAFFSVNPLSDGALDEIERCSKNPVFKGLKLHFGNSRVNMLNSSHVEKVRRVFKAANDHHLPIVVHLWTSENYVPADAQAFLEKVLPVAPDIPIQIAHMAATGPGYTNDEVLEVYAKAAEEGDPRMKNVYFDVASDVVASTPKDTLDLVAKRLRQLGLKRILFGTDRAGGKNESPREAWANFLKLPLTPDDFRMIAENVAPYAR